MKQFSVCIGRTIRELKGQSCISLEDPHLPAKRILASRSFAAALTDKTLIKQAMIFHLSRAHERLTAQKQLCACVHVSLYEKITVKPYKFSHSHVIGLEYPTDDLLILSHATQQQIDVLFKENKRYVKVAVMFSALIPKNTHIPDLWQPHTLIAQRDSLMHTLGSMKERFGKHYIQVGYHTAQQQWQMKQLHRSPRYTTSWSEMLIIDDSHLAVTQNK